MKERLAILVSLVFLWGIGEGSRVALAFADDSVPQPEVATVRSRIDLTAMIDQTIVIPTHLITPEMAQNIGPGSHLIITIPGEGTFGCTANFVWGSGENRYLGAAGHCFLPAT